jgi:NADH-quinone oxidoreductase subunit E
LKHLIPEFDAMRARFPEGFSSSMVLPCLHRIQEDQGHIGQSDIDALVEYLGVPRVQIEEVLSFYSMFRIRPGGRWQVAVCRNVSCSMRGAERLLAHLGRRLGIAPGETTPDGRITLETVECLGSCGTAPVMVLNGEYRESMSVEALDALIEGLD